MNKPLFLEMLKIMLDKSKRFCYNIFVANECYEEDEKIFLAFFEAEKGGGEIFAL